jgi:hypothetical protein
MLVTRIEEYKNNNNNRAIGEETISVAMTYL